jgi:hypothetical protein
MYLDRYSALALRDCKERSRISAAAVGGYPGKFSNPSNGVAAIIPARRSNKGLLIIA